MPYRPSCWPLQERIESERYASSPPLSIVSLNAVRSVFALFFFCFHWTIKQQSHSEYSHQHDLLIQPSRGARCCGQHRGATCDFSEASRLKAVKVVKGAATGFTTFTCFVSMDAEKSQSRIG
jgi:hypothetical protein